MTDTVDVRAPIFRGAMLFVAGVILGASLAFAVLAVVGMSPMSRLGWWTTAFFCGAAAIVGYIAMRDQRATERLPLASTPKLAFVAPVMFVIGLVVGAGAIAHLEWDRYDDPYLRSECRVALTKLGDASDEKVTECARWMSRCGRQAMVLESDDPSMNRYTRLPHANLNCALRRMGIQKD